MDAAKADFIAGGMMFHVKHCFDWKYLPCRWLLAGLFVPAILAAMFIIHEFFILIFHATGAGLPKKISAICTNSAKIFVQNRETVKKQQIFLTNILVSLIIRP